jgi:hypothetical protein
MIAFYGRGGRGSLFVNMLVCLFRVYNVPSVW